jgi:transcriptional regulator with XRE-family HTH domain
MVPCAEVEKHTGRVDLPFWREETMERDDDPELLRFAVALLRITRRLTKKQMAEAVGISRSSLADYESGRRQLPWEMMERIAVAAGLSPTALDLLLASLRRVGKFKRYGPPPPLADPELEDLVKEISSRVEIALWEIAEVLWEGERKSPTKEWSN